MSLFSKDEIHAVLQLASKFHNEVASLPFVAAEIPDAVHQAISAEYAKLQNIAKTTTHAFGFELRNFANKHVPAVIAAIESPLTATIVESFQSPVATAVIEAVQSSVGEAVVDAVGADIEKVVEAPVVEAPAQ